MRFRLLLKSTESPRFARKLDKGKNNNHEKKEPFSPGFESARGSFLLEGRIRNQMGESISREEHKEFAQRIDEENRRQNHRIELLEQNLREVHGMTASIEKLAINMESMVKEQEKQGKRLEVLEGRDGEMWRKVVGYIVTAVIGIVVGFIFTQIGM